MEEEGAGYRGNLDTVATVFKEEGQEGTVDEVCVDADRTQRQTGMIR